MTSKTNLLTLLKAVLVFGVASYTTVAMDRQEILGRFAQGNFEIPALDQSIQRVVVMFGDPGYDGADILENIAALSLEKDAILVIVTNLWKPDEKATLVEAVAKKLGRMDRVFICAGSGCYTDDGKNFMELYPAWPKAAFGDPTYVNPALSEAQRESYKGVYNEQLEAYRLVLGVDDSDKKRFSEKDPISFIKNILAPYAQNYALEIFMSGPPTDMAKLLMDEELSDHVRVVRGIMGGGFGPFGEESRMGYNFVLSPSATQDMIQQIRDKQIPTLVVTSQTCSTIPIKKEDFTNFIDNRNKRPLAEAVAIGWKKWNQHMSLKRGRETVDVNIPDVVTLMLSYYAEHVGQVTRGYYNMHPEEATLNGVHMLSPEAKKLFDTVADDNSPLFFVGSVKEPEAFYEKVLAITIGQLKLLD